VVHKIGASPAALRVKFERAGSAIRIYRDSEKGRRVTSIFFQQATTSGELGVPFAGRFDHFWTEYCNIEAQEVPLVMNMVLHSIIDEKM
jgi:hypothetical protein